MTKTEFANKCGVRVRTVDSWLSHGYVRGVKKIDNDFFIPDDAKAPYTKNRTKPTSKQTDIMKSILRGINSNCAVFAEVYKFETEDFQRYINSLVRGGLIEEVLFSENIPYYQLTVAGMELMEKSDKEILSVLKGLAGGVLNAVGVAATVFGVVAV